MRCAILTNNIVTNIVLMREPKNGAVALPESPRVGIGWRYINGEWLEPLPEPIDPERLQQDFTAEVQKRLDDFARTRMYDDIKSLSDYAGDADPVFNAEGTYGKSLRSQTWRAAINYMQDILAGNKPMPASVEEAITAANLPTPEWPS